jgi:hypothetical protein
MKGYRGNWEQNDSTADDYIKNRTHWSESTKKIIVKKQTIDGFTVMQEPIYAVVNAFAMEPVVGQTYIINWDGVDYSVVAKEDSNSGMIYMGNTNYIYMSPGGDIPFAILFAAGGIFVATESSATSHTITISTIQEVVHKLDKKFIDMPDNIVSEDNIYDILENNLAPVAFTNDYDSLSGKPTDMIRYTAQTLTNEQAIQARANIGAAENYMLELVQQKIEDDCVRSDMVQSLTDQQKFRARENIGVINFSGDYNDLDNKPCEKIVVDEVTLVSGTVDFSADTTDSAHVNNTRKTPISDYMYRVIIGETTYYLSPVECYSPDSIYNYPCFALGNLFHMDNAQANTGEPFCIVFLETILVGSFSVQIYWDKTVLNTSMDVTVIQEEKVTYVQLDEEYIPDTIARTADIPALAIVATTGSYNDLADKPIGVAYIDLDDNEIVLTDSAYINDLAVLIGGDA